MVTERDLAVLLALDQYYVLSRPLLQKLCFPTDTDGRATRRRLQSLVDAKLINRQNLLFAHPNGGSPASVYFPAVLGGELLAQHFDANRYLATNTHAPIPHHVPHWLAVSETHMAFDAAVAREASVEISGWVNEWDIVNKDEAAPEKRYRLYTLIRETPRLVCAPDAAFVMSSLGHHKVFYVEQDRATSGARQLADSKTRGYAAMAEADWHVRHFPVANVRPFNVLLIAPSPKRRDILRDAIRNKPGASLWKFAAQQDLHPETLLHAPVFHACEGAPTSLLRRKET
jgi:hypothetical protein